MNPQDSALFLIYSWCRILGKEDDEIYEKLVKDGDEQYLKWYKKYIVDKVEEENPEDIWHVPDAVLDNIYIIESMEKIYDERINKC